MKLFARLRSWLKWIVKGKRLENEMETEVRFHIESYAADLVRGGVPQQEAMRRARIEFGGVESHKDAMRASLGLRLCGELCADVRYGARMLCRSPGFTAIAVASLALGIGANTAIFTVTKKVLLDTLPVKKPHELRMLSWVSGHEQPVPPVWGDVSSTDGGGLMSTAFSYRVLEELRKKTEVFQDLIAFKDIDEMSATVDGHAQLVAGEMVSGNVFSVLGVEPILGRPLTSADDAGPGKGPVAVISEGYWAERFGRSTSALGKTISLNGVPITLVGVSPARFTGLRMGSTAQIFVPLTMQPLLVPRPQLTRSGNSSLLDNPQSWWVSIIARLRPDLPEERTQAAFDLVLRQTAMATLPTATGLDQFHLKLQPGDRGLDYLQSFAKPSYVLLALAGLVLLLACVNLANLLLARAATRQREMSTRLALGAGRARILRQLLTESLLLSCLGGAAGLLVGYAGRNAIPRLFENPWRLATMQADFDWRVLAFTAGVSLVTGILFGAVPAWEATRGEVNTALKDASHTAATQHGFWLGKGLVVFQIMLSTILLIGAGLFVRTLVNLSHTPLGFRADHILLFQLNPPRTRYQDAQMVALYNRLEEKLAVIPGVRLVAMSNIAIIGDGHSGSTFHVSGRPERKDEDRVQTNAVGSDFFQTMGIAVLQGRDFNVRDTVASPKVALVNRALARQFFPNKDPIGQTFTCDSDDGDGLVQIVGIVADTRYADLRSETPPTFYVPYQQRPRSSRMVVEIRTVTDPGSILSQVRSAVESLDRDLPLIDIRTMTEQIKASLSGERIFAQLTSGFGMLALVLAAIGIYGIMAYTVARRVNEIGIRMALGAQTSQVLLMVLREASGLAGIGIGAGLGAAMLLTQFLRSMLFGLKPTDPFTLASAGFLLFAIAMLAGWGPARRASRIQPMQALRHE
jgi:predicted permease